MEPKQQYCLKWNNHKSNISGVFDRLRTHQRFIDVTLASADHKTIKCHRLLLSAGSGYLEKILEQIDIITLDQEFQSINATLEENIVDNKLNINFKIEEAEKYYLSRFNILGNNITRENVIRNNLEIDEGEIFKTLLASE